MSTTNSTAHVECSFAHGRLRSSSFIFALLLSVAHCAIPWAQAEQPDACEIFTRNDAGKIFKTEIAEGVSRSATMPAGRSCRYTYQMDGSAYGVTVRISTDAEIREEGINDSGVDLMTRQKNARTNNPYASTTYKELTGLADDAFWNGTDLWVLKGQTLFIVKSSSHLKGSFTNQDEAGKAAEARNLQVSLEVADVILPRLQ